MDGAGAWFVVRKRGNTGTQVAGIQLCPHRFLQARGGFASWCGEPYTVRLR